MDSEVLATPIKHHIGEVWNIIAPSEALARAMALNYYPSSHVDLKIIGVVQEKIDMILESHPY